MKDAWYAGLTSNSMVERASNGPEWPVWALAVAQTLNWSFLFYIFTAMAPAWLRTHDWSSEGLYSAMMVALLASAVVAPRAGRWLDLGHGPMVLTAGGTTAALLLALVPVATELWQFWALWFAIGGATGFCLYPACFGWITVVKQDQARPAITRVTLVAGFASTLCFPYVYWLSGIIGWETTLWSGVAIVVFVASPLSWWGASRLKGPGLTVDSDTVGSESMGVIKPENLHSPFARPVFWMLAVLFLTWSISHSIVVFHLVTITELQTGMAEWGVLAMTCIGPAQVAGRVALMSVERRVGNSFVAVLMVSTAVVAASTLLLINVLAGLVFLFAVLQGASHGVHSIIKPLIIRDIMGNRRFGWVSGLLAMPQQIGFAVAPMLGAVILVNAGPWSLQATILGLTLIALAALLSALAMTRIPDQSPGTTR